MRESREWRVKIRMTMNLNCSKLLLLGTCNICWACSSLSGTPKGVKKLGQLYEEVMCRIPDQPEKTLYHPEIKFEVLTGCSFVFCQETARLKSRVAAQLLCCTCYRVSWYLKPTIFSVVLLNVYKVQNVKNHLHINTQLLKQENQKLQILYLVQCLWNTGGHFHFIPSQNIFSVQDQG